MPGIQRDKNRKKAPVFVDLTTPHGAEITVSEQRATALLARGPVRFNDDVERRYVEGHGLDDDANVVPAVRSGARPPRTGNRQNTVPEAATVGVNTPPPSSPNSGKGDD